MITIVVDHKPLESTAWLLPLALRQAGRMNALERQIFVYEAP